MGNWSKPPDPEIIQMALLLGYQCDIRPDSFSFTERSHSPGLRSLPLTSADHGPA